MRVVKGIITTLIVGAFVSVGVVYFISRHQYIADTYKSDIVSEKKFDQKIDLGLLGPGEIRRGSFEVENDTDDVLAVTTVVSTCGCLTSDLKKRIFKPGEKVNVNFLLESPVKFGYLDKAISVFFDKKAKSPVLVQVTGTVCMPVDSAEKLIDLGILKEGQKITKNVSLSSFLAIDLSDDSVKIDSKLIKRHRLTRISATSTLQNYNLALDIEVPMRNESTPIAEERFSSQIEISDSKRDVRLIILLKAAIQPIIVATPGSVFFGIIKNGDKLTRSVTLSVDPGNESILDRISFGHEFGGNLQAQLKRDPSNRCVANFSIIFDPGQLSGTVVRPVIFKLNEKIILELPISLHIDVVNK